MKRPPVIYRAPSPDELLTPAEREWKAKPLLKTKAQRDAVRAQLRARLQVKA
jgi:hypothetical protein